MTTPTTTTLDARVVPIDRVIDNPLNLRVKVGDVAELTTSIKSLGILEPLVVTEIDLTDDARADDRHPAFGPGFVLIAGHRRLAAAKQAGLTEVPVVVRNGNSDQPAEQIIGMLVENLQRSDLTPSEEGKGYQALMDFGGWTAAKISRRVGRQTNTVKSRLAIAGLPPEAQDKIDRGQITIEQAGAFAEFAADKKATDALLKSLGKGNSSYEFDYTARRLREQRETIKRVAASMKILDAAGLTPLVVGDVAKGADLPINWRYSHSVPTKPLDDLYDAKIVKVATLPDDWDTDYEITEAKHAKCKGHAAILDGRGQILHVCTDPAKHGHVTRSQIYALRREAGLDDGTPGGSQPREVDPELEAQREAERVAREALGTAGEVRWEFLTGALRVGTKRKDDTATTLALLRMLAYQAVRDDIDEYTALAYADTGERVGSLLGLPNDGIAAAYLEDTDDDLDDEQRVQAFWRAQIAKWTAGDLLRFLFARDVVDRSETTLTSPRQFQDEVGEGQPGQVFDYYATLGVLGYAPVEVEQTFLTPPPPEPSDTDDAADDPETPPEPSASDDDVPESWVRRGIEVIPICPTCKSSRLRCVRPSGHDASEWHAPRVALLPRDDAPADEPQNDADESVAPPGDDDAPDVSGSADDAHSPADDPFGEPESTPDVPADLGPLADAFAKLRDGVLPEADSDLVCRVGGGQSDVVLKPGVKTALGRCRHTACGAWVAIRVGHRAGKHVHNTRECPGTGQKVLAPREHLTRYGTTR